MRLPLMIFGAWVAVTALLAAMILTTDRALPAHFPRGTEACFGRVYDQAFLAANPNQRLAELYVFRDFVPGGPREDKRARAVQVAADRASVDDLSMTVVARFRDKPIAYDRASSAAPTARSARAARPIAKAHRSASIRTGVAW